MLKSARPTVSRRSAAHRRSVNERLTRPTHQRLTRRRGVAFLEFALLLPLLVLLVIGIVQYGMIASTITVLTNLSREGARYASLSAATTDADIIKYVKDSAASTRVNANDLTITLSPPEADRTAATQVGQKVTVTVKYNLTKQLFLPGTQFLVNAFSKKGEPGFYETTATMRTQAA